MSSNHQALYIHIFADVVEYQLSINVPIAIDAGNRKNSTVIKRFEAKYLRIKSFIKRSSSLSQRYVIGDKKTEKN